MEEDEKSYKLKFCTELTENMGRALGIGFCYVGTKFSKAEIYVYINLWKYNLAIGRITKWAN